MGNILLKNAVSNVAAKVWSIISLYLFVPFWIDYLGVEGYGVISFYTILMTLMAFADAGLSATLTREFAKVEPFETYREDLLKTIEAVYVAIALIIGCGIYLLAPYIASTFLKSETIPVASLVGYVRIMAPILSFNFMYMLYTGGLMGLQKQVSSNVLNIGYSISRSALVLIALYFVPTVDMFLYWQLISIIAVTVLARFYLKRSVDTGSKKPKFHFDYLKDVWKYALGMMAMAIISSLNTQLDKLVVGNILSVKEMGFYSLAGTIGQAVLFITAPLGIAFYPELTKLISCGNKERAEEYFYMFAFIVSSLSSCIGFTLFFYINELTTLWLKDSIVPFIAIPARLLILGNIFMSLQYSVYYLAIAHGHTKTNVFLGSLMLLLTIPSVFWLTREYGLNGAAMPYLFLNVIATIYLGVVIMNKFLKHQFKKWLMYSCTPLCVCTLFMLISYYLITNMHLGEIETFALGCMVSIITGYVLLVLFYRLFPECFQYRFFNRISLIIPNKFRK